MEGRIVRIDNSRPSDNVIINKSGRRVSVACSEAYGTFAVHLSPGESKRVTDDVDANVFPHGEYEYDNLIYHLGTAEIWEVHSDGSALVMAKVEAR